MRCAMRCDATGERRETTDVDSFRGFQLFELRLAQSETSVATDAKPGCEAGGGRTHRCAREWLIYASSCECV